jgi:hypothetical protein
MQPRSPIRAPHYFWDGDGPATLASAQFLLGLLCDFARLSPVWKDRAGRDVLVTVEHEARGDARIALGGAFDGHIELVVTPSLWVRADVFLSGAWFARGWIERCFEECEIWPDGADGVVGPRVEDDPPGRISKRGSWVQFDTSQWPGYVCAERHTGFRIPEA